MNRRRILPASPLCIPIAASLLLQASCAPRLETGPRGEGPPILATALGPPLRAMWQAVGGIDAWRKLGTLRLTHVAELGPAAEGGAPGVAKFGPTTVEFTVGDWSRLRVEDGDGPRELDLRAPAASADARDYALRSARVFFTMPFAFADPGWEFRLERAPGAPADARTGFWAVPMGIPSPHRSYAVQFDAASGLPRAVVYQVAHPAFENRVLKAVFGGFRTVGGVRLPGEITHLIAGAPPRPDPRYPWEGAPVQSLPIPPEGAVAPSSASEERVFLRERLTEIQLLESGR